MAQRKTSAKSKNASRSKAKSASHKTKSSAAKPAASRETRKPGEAEVTIDRRRNSRRGDEAEGPAPVKLERRKKVNRRRQIDPTTCERDYTDDEIQFMNAMDDYKRASGRMFPTCSEVLEVVRSLGYVRLSPSELAARAPQEPQPVEVAVGAEVESFESDSADDWQ